MLENVPLGSTSGRAAGGPPTHAPRAPETGPAADLHHAVAFGLASAIGRRIGSPELNNPRSAYLRGRIARLACIMCPAQLACLPWVACLARDAGRIRVSRAADVAQMASIPGPGSVADVAWIAWARIIAQAPGRVSTVHADVRKISAPTAAVAPLVDRLETSPAG